MPGLSNVDSPRPDWLQLLLGAPLPAPETNTKSPLRHHSPGGSASCLISCRLITLDLFLLWKGQHFVLTGIDTYSGYKFAFPMCSASAKTTICGLTECLLHPHAIPHGSVSDQGAHFTAKEVQQWTHAHWSYMFPTILKANGLIEWWNGLLKTQLKCQVGGDTLQGQGKVL